MKSLSRRLFFSGFTHQLLFYFNLFYFLCRNRSKQKTFNMKKGSMRFQKGMTLKANLAATLQGGVDVKEAVKLPPDEDLNEWLAINSKFLGFEGNLKILIFVYSFHFL
jgi:hypothetical protein